MYQGKMVFSDTIASGASTSAGINLQRSWNQAYLCVSTMSTATQFTLQSSPDGGSTFFPVIMNVPNTSSVQANVFTVATGIGSSSGFIQLPAVGPYLRFVLTAVVSGGVSFKVVCQSD